MDRPFGSTGDGPSVQQVVEDLVGERIEALAAWIQELDAQVRATATAADEKALKELRKTLEAWSKRDPKFEERLIDRVDVLADRLATLSSAVNTTAAAHASSEGEFAALRRELEQETATIHAALREHGAGTVARDLEQLRSDVAELARGRPSSRDSGDATALRELVENLRERVDVLAKTVATTAAGLAGREGDLAALRRALDASSERVEELVATLRQPAPDHELRTRLDEQARRSDASAAELRTSLSTLESRLTALAEEQVEGLEARLDRVSSMLEDLRGSLESRPEPASMAELEARIAPLQGQLDGLAARVLEADAQAAERLARESARTSKVEELVHGLRSGLDELDARLGERVDTAVAAIAGTRSDVDALSSEMSRRVAALEHEQGALAAQIDGTRDALATQKEGVAELHRKHESSATELARVRASWDEERSAVREQVEAALAALSEEVASARETFLAEKERLETELRELPAALAPIPPSEDDRLRRLLTAFADRIEAMDRERAALAARLASLENPPAEPAPAPLPGDGRLRAELRALELRLEHAEAAAHEGREAVLAQLERLASRVEWRLQRLEAGDEPEPVEAALENGSLGEVVPIRGGVET